VRLLLKDNTTARELLQDEEIAFYLTQNGNNLYRAAADAARSLASREGKSKSVGDLSISGLGDTWLLVASEFERRADGQATPYAGGISVADKQTYEQDTDRVTPAFTRGLHNTPGTVNSTGST
jgi:hypothetical protein